MKKRYKLEITEEVTPHEYIWFGDEFIDSLEEAIERAKYLSYEDISGDYTVELFDNAIGKEIDFE